MRLPIPISLLTTRRVMTATPSPSSTAVLIGLVVGKFQRDGDADVVSPDVLLGASAGRRSLFMDDEGVSGKILGFDERFRREGVSRGDDDLVAVLQDFPRRRVSCGGRDRR